MPFVLVCIYNCYKLLMRYTACQFQRSPCQHLSLPGEPLPLPASVRGEHHDGLLQQVCALGLVQVLVLRPAQVWVVLTRP